MLRFIYKSSLRMAALAALQIASAEPAPGLIAQFEQNGSIDAMRLPNAAFYFSPNHPPSGLHGQGPLQVSLEGFVSVELRAQHSFQVESSGSAELFVNGASVLAFAGGGMSELSKPVRLNKGTNALRLAFTAKEGEPAQARVFWKTRSLALPIPIPLSALSHEPNHPLLRERNLLRQGAYAIAEYNCLRCHSDSSAKPKPLNAPSLARIGERLRSDWIASWLAEPSKHRSDARMPVVVNAEEGRAIAEFLASTAEPAPHEISGSADKGAKLFETLQCSRCHTVEPQHNDGRLSLSHAGQKYFRGALLDFLRNPRQHHSASRMPNFRLTEKEAGDLARFLAPQNPPTPAKATVSAGGRELVQTKGCLNCHAGPENLESKLHAKALAALQNLEAGCLDSSDSRTPRFPFRDGEKDAIRAALQAGKPVFPERASSIEVALRETETLRCATCHNAADGVIRLELIGGKLKPEWSARMIEGALPYKPRPWLAARMPSFHQHGAPLAEGLAALHGVPPTTPAEPPLDVDAAATGARLVSAAGGFSCVACHPVGANSSGVVVESPGVNFAYSGERLLRSFFDRWVMNPAALDPATKMPVYFDEAGHSQLLDFYEGDGPKQIEAMWHYIRQGDKMPPPPTP